MQSKEAGPVMRCVECGLFFEITVPISRQKTINHNAHVFHLCKNCYNNFLQGRIMLESGV